MANEKVAQTTGGYAVLATYWSRENKRYVKRWQRIGVWPTKAAAWQAVANMQHADLEDGGTEGDYKVVAS